MSLNDSPGGNSGKMRGYLVQPVGDGPFPTVLVVHENRGLNPYIEDVARRAATSVSVSYDVRRTFTSTPLATQVAQFIAVEQDGVVRNFFGGVTTSTTFVDFSVADIVPLFADVNWIDGSAIRFGFGMSAFAGGGIPFTLAGGYDNFEVTVNFESSSEPVPLAVFAFSAIWFFARRRKAV